MITQIAASAEAQSASLQQVNSSVGEMDRMTQQNAAMVEESTAAARSLAGEASELATLVTRFNLGNQSVKTTPRAVATPARIRSAPMPKVSGNLALSVDKDEWSEF